ncbi:MAG: glycosyltransferase family 2 protein [Verrucomicrobia bacterium]|jgi:cellulose synthase/poly-beta-1,6-N-acetylglucosamine synthase-like glycosyltransferase|nr:glycosyltransferase family 2 protein [Verrucomicrobiota bacterium]
MVLLNALLIGSLALLGYTWVGYPALLAVCARLFGRAAEALPDIPDSELPHLHIICSAYNEAQVIAARLENLAELDYPVDRISVHIGTDGCTDDTAGIVEGKAEGGKLKAELGKVAKNISLHLLEFTENRGKPAVLKDLVSQVCDPTSALRPRPPALLVFTDANTMFRPDAMRKLVRHFGDPGIGGVCGRLLLRPPISDLRSPAPEGSYWRFETKLKTWESMLDSCLGANGAIYAIRPELFWPALPANTIVDDFVIGMKVREQGRRVVYEPAAVAEEELPEIADEWQRRVRIGAGDYQAVGFCRRCLSPRLGWFAWAFFSHKVLRWFTPHLMLLVAITAVTGSIITRTPFQLSAFPPHPSLSDLVSVSGVAVALLWGVARAISAFNFHPSSLSLVDHFMTMQAALTAGFMRYCRGGVAGTWHRTPRG